MFQEIIHGGPEDSQGGCLSFLLLFDIIRLKIKFPNQVHIILGNHDTAYINKAEIMKNGKEMNQAMRGAMQRYFGAGCEAVDMALRQYMFSQPLAVRCENRIWISHSLPADAYMKNFDPGIFNRQLKVNDVVRPNSAYLLTWGRRHKQETLDALAKLFDVDLFVLGHQSQDTGYAQAGNNLLIIASDHSHGCLLPVELSKKYTIQGLIDSLVPLAGIEV